MTIHVVCRDSTFEDVTDTERKAKVLSLLHREQSGHTTDYGQVE